MNAACKGRSSVQLAHKQPTQKKNKKNIAERQKLWAQSKVSQSDVHVALQLSGLFVRVQMGAKLIAAPDAS